MPKKAYICTCQSKKERMKSHNLTASVIMAMALTATSLFTTEANAQQAGTLNVEFMTPSLDSLITHCQRSNYNQTQLDGFRVQIYSGSGIKSKDEAASAQARFLKAFPDKKAYIIYNAPFWRVRVGDFRSRSEAMAMLNEVKPSFSGSYIVRDNTVRKKNFRQ